MVKKKDISDTNTPVLIVDDNPQYTMVLKKMLQGVFGYGDVTCVEDIQSAFEIVAKNEKDFGLLFVDYSFPCGDTGVVFLEHLQKENILQDAVAFLITSDPTIENVNSALAAGALGVVAKPFDRQELTKQLEKARRAIVTDGMDSF